jgi:hypothetical protein
VCGKVRFLSRREAKTMAKRYPDSKRLNAYQCGEFWHLGTLPPVIARGNKSRSDLRERAEWLHGVHNPIRQSPWGEEAEGA